MTEQLQLDLQGRLRNFKLPATRALVPVFEAVVNSLHAIEDGRTSGYVRIEVQRHPLTQAGSQQPLPLAPDQVSLPPIVGFRIRDNGVGFTDENYASFCTSDSTRKLAIGGRGVGRFTWLKAFASVSVESVYKGAETDQWLHRLFRFSEHGVAEMQVAACDVKPVVETVVTLEGLRDPYSSHVPKRTSTLAQHVVDHLFGVARATTRPVQIELIDGDESVDVGAEIALMLKSALVDQFNLCGQPFTVTHVRVGSPEVSAHKLVLMGNGREVRREPLANEIPQLRAKLQDGEKAFWWWSLVESPALDEHVTPERDDFTLPSDGEVLPGILSLPAIRESALTLIKARLEPLVAPIKERTREQVQQFVQRDAPEYRPLVAIRPEIVERLPPDLTKERLDMELHKANYELEASIRAQGKRILGGEHVKADDYDRFLSEENALGKANLAKYIVHRRVVLDLFRRALERKEDGKYSLEESVHKLIFPLKKTSDDVPYEQLNLWMIDERLAYHYYLASDKELRSAAVLESNDRQRPDLIVFNAPFAFTDATPFSSIIIVEFKRPARDDYTDDENPITQVFEYITRVREGKAVDRAGRPVEVPDALPFYCYVICDLTLKMRQAAKFASLTEAPDRAGYFGYNPNYGAYVEVISFNKLVADAEKRNRVFFEKLNIK
jgi:hypothetical protein